MAPCLARIAGLVDAVSRLNVAADTRLAHADENQVGTGLGHRDGADRGRLDLAIGDRRPMLSAVRGLPKAAAGRAEVAFPWATLHPGDRDGTATALGADGAPLIRFEKRRIDQGTGPAQHRPCSQASKT